MTKDTRLHVIVYAILALLAGAELAIFYAIKHLL